MLIVHNEKLLDFIKARYSLTDIQNLANFLRDRGTFDFPTLETGLFPAAVLTDETEYTGYASVWVRDNVKIAHAHYIRGKVEIARKTLLSLMTYFQKHRSRFVRIVEGEADPDDVMNRPHVRFDGNRLEEIDEKWAHAQNDALGYFLWFYCELARAGIIQPQSEELNVLALFPLYFQAIRYWEDEDSGHWEEARKIEASSIGTVVAGLQSLHRLLQDESLLAEFQYQEKPVALALVGELIAAGNKALERILPAECIQPEPEKNRRYDAALLFLIYPLKVVDEAMSDRILADIIQNLQGGHGIRRYLEDSFWCADYKKKLPSEERTSDFSENMAARDELLQEVGNEAQWCVFDSIVSVIFGLKFQKSKQQTDLEKQIHYLNRSLGQITGEDSGLGVFQCPELYYLKEGRYVPNDATPLLWTQANLAIALTAIEQSLSIA
jgi:phosphorylase kinase alpha/beta subunit